MGQKVHPIGFRLGFVKGWDSDWNGGNDHTAKRVWDQKDPPGPRARHNKARGDNTD